MGVRYFDVESFLIEYIREHKIVGKDPANHSFDIEEIELGSILDSEDAVVFEATGSAEYFPHYGKMYTNDMKNI